MKQMYQVQSKFKCDFEWLDDKMPFESEEEAKQYIKTQPKCLEYRIVSFEEPETAEEWLEWDVYGI